MEDKEAVDAIIDAIQQTAHNAKYHCDLTGSADKPDRVLQYASATRELAQALQALGVGLTGR